MITQEQIKLVDVSDFYHESQVVISKFFKKNRSWWDLFRVSTGDTEDACYFLKWFCLALRVVPITGDLGKFLREFIDDYLISFERCQKYHWMIYGVVFNVTINHDDCTISDFIVDSWEKVKDRDPSVLKRDYSCYGGNTDPDEYDWENFSISAYLVNPSITLEQTKRVLSADKKNKFTKIIASVSVYPEIHKSIITGEHDDGDKLYLITNGSINADILCDLIPLAADIADCNRSWPPPRKVKWPWYPEMAVECLRLINRHPSATIRISRQLEDPFVQKMMSKTCLFKQFTNLNWSVHKNYELHKNAVLTLCSGIRALGINGEVDKDCKMTSLFDAQLLRDNVAIYAGTWSHETSHNGLFNGYIMSWTWGYPGIVVKVMFGSGEFDVPASPNQQSPTGCEIWIDTGNGFVQKPATIEEANRIGQLLVKMRVSWKGLPTRCEHNLRCNCSVRFNAPPVLGSDRHPALIEEDLHTQKVNQEKKYKDAVITLCDGIRNLGFLQEKKYKDAVIAICTGIRTLGFLQEKKKKEKEKELRKQITILSMALFDILNYSLGSKEYLRTAAENWLEGDKISLPDQELIDLANTFF